MSKKFFWNSWDELTNATVKRRNLSIVGLVCYFELCNCRYAWNPIFISLIFINVIFLPKSISLDQRNPCNLSTDQALLLSATSVEVVRICHYTKKGPIGSSIWFDFKNCCSTPARKEKNWSLATVNGSSTKTLKFL